MLSKRLVLGFIVVLFFLLKPMKLSSNQQSNKSKILISNCFSRIPAPLRVFLSLNFNLNYPLLLLLNMEPDTSLTHETINDYDFPTLMVSVQGIHNLGTQLGSDLGNN